MNADRQEPWVRRIHRGRLTPEEAAALRREASERGEAAGLEEELALDEALGSLPEPVISSNFTSRVMAAVKLEEQAAARRRRAPMMSGWWLRWSGRIPAALAGGALLVMLAAWQFRGVERQRQAEDVARVVRAAEAPQAANLPSLETLQDFDAIQLATPRPRVDYVGLVAALNE